MSDINTAVSEEMDEEMDEEMTSALIRNLLGGQNSRVDFRDFRTRDLFEKTVRFENFGLNDEGWVIYRDGKILGAHPSMLIPQPFVNKYSECVVTITMHEESIDQFSDSINLVAPQPLNPARLAEHCSMYDEYHFTRNQLGLKLNGREKIVLKQSKLNWTLSSSFKQLAQGKKYPCFVFIVTPIVAREIVWSASIRSPKFTVRSKPQPAQIDSQSGLSVAKKTKRKTAEQEALYRALQQKTNSIGELQEELQELERRLAIGLTSGHLVQSLLDADNSHTFQNLSVQNKDILQKLTSHSQFTNGWQDNQPETSTTDHQITVLPSNTSNKRKRDESTSI